jgi:hypothetical protein
MEGNKMECTNKPYELMVIVDGKLEGSTLALPTKIFNEYNEFEHMHVVVSYGEKIVAPCAVIKCSYIDNCACIISTELAKIIGVTTIVNIVTVSLVAGDMLNKTSNLDFLELHEPTNEELLGGPKENKMYVNVPDSYLNGFINHVNIIGAYAVERYKESDYAKTGMTMERYHRLLYKIRRGCSNLHYTDMGDDGTYDDVHMLTKCGNFYYYFWYCRSGNSCISKFSKSKFESDGQAMAAVKETIIDRNTWIFDKDYVREHEEDYIRYIPADFFNGWITL